MPGAALVLSVLGPLFLGLAAMRIVREGWPPGPAARTWMTVGAIFSALAVYLWMTQGQG